MAPTIRLSSTPHPTGFPIANHEMKATPRNHLYTPPCPHAPSPAMPRSQREGKKTNRMLSLEETPQILQPLPRRLGLVNSAPATFSAAVLVHAQTGKLLLLVLELEHLLLEAVGHDVPHGGHLAFLAEAVHAVDGLRFGGGVVLGFQDVDCAVVSV